MQRVHTDQMQPESVQKPSETAPSEGHGGGLGAHGCWFCGAPPGYAGCVFVFVLYPIYLKKMPVYHSVQ